MFISFNKAVYIRHKMMFHMKRAPVLNIKIFLFSFALWHISVSLMLQIYQFICQIKIIMLISYIPSCFAEIFALSPFTYISACLRASSINIRIRSFFSIRSSSFAQRMLSKLPLTPASFLFKNL